MLSPDEWMVIGRIAGPFGVRGEVKLEPLTDFPERFQRLKSVYVGPDHHPVEIEASRPHKRHILVQLAGVASPEAAERLRGLEVAVPRTEAVALPAGHYFLEDLIGFPVRTPAGDTVGQITEVLRTGGNDVYVVAAGSGEILVPATRDAIHELDLTGHQVIVEPWALQPPE